MFIRYLPFLLLLLTSRILANEYPVEIFEYLDDTKVVAFLKNSDIDKTAEWVPLETEVPLNINSALKAISDLAATDDSLKLISLTSIEIKQIPGHPNHWHYLVEMTTENTGKIQPQYFIVLLDGKVIPAVKEPEGFK
ncbi:MAG: hypothetical protein RQ982_04980 [Gammaproteobacteria bacterium]|nr:hypothetical protein [Gammaproteobacteria bacterium]